MLVELRDESGGGSEEWDSEYAMEPGLEDINSKSEASR